jgi:uncharacterized protein
VTDYAGVLGDEEAVRITSTLAVFEDETSCEFAVLTVPTLQGERIESFSLRVARSWGLGKVGASNGLLIVLAHNDRTARIEVADGLLEVIPDGLSLKIMDEMMVPAFRDGRYADGIEAGLRSLMEAIRR